MFHSHFYRTTGHSKVISISLSLYNHLYIALVLYDFILYDYPLNILVMSFHFNITICPQISSHLFFFLDFSLDPLSLLLSFHA